MSAVNGVPVTSSRSNCMTVTPPPEYCSSRPGTRSTFTGSELAGGRPSSTSASDGSGTPAR
jgi:hypothetical protein